MLAVCPSADAAPAWFSISGAPRRAHYTTQLGSLNNQPTAAPSFEGLIATPPGRSVSPSGEAASRHFFAEETAMSLYFADWIVHATKAELLAQRVRLQDERRTCRTAEARKILGAVIRCINEEIDHRAAPPLRRAAG